jgi:hypothetical protein
VRTLKAASAEQLSVASSLPSLEGVVLELERSVRGGDLLLLPAGLRSLRVESEGEGEYYGATGASISGLARLTSLETLSVTDWTPVSQVECALHATLQTLELGCEFNDDLLTLVVDRCPLLETLNIDNPDNTLSACGVRCLARAARLRGVALPYLDAHDTVAALAALRCCPLLESLDVMACQVGSDACPDLLTVGRRLHALCLELDSTQVLVVVTQLTTLQRLDLRANRLDDGAIVSLDFLARFPRLTRLRVAGAFSLDSTLESVQELDIDDWTTCSLLYCFPHLRALEIGRVGDEDMAIITGLRMLTSLSIFDAQRITDWKLAALALSRAPLVHLNLGYCRVTEENLSFLADLGKLESLCLQSSQVSKAAVSRAWDQMPNLEELVFRQKIA